jgi:hypothetical protein
MSGAPNPRDLFSDAKSDAERAERFEAYKSALSDNIKAAHAGSKRYVHGEGFSSVAPVDNSTGERIEKLRELSKSLSGDQAAEIQATLNSMQADLRKEIDSGGAGSAGTPSLGGNTTLGQTQGFVPVDLEAPSKKMVPRETVTRNLLPRDNSGKGSGLSYRRVRGWSNSNSSASVGDMTSFFSSEQENTSYSGVAAIRRPNQIAYATDVNTVAYMEQGLGSSVSWRSQYAGAGYEDIRQLAATALLYSTMTAENKNLLYARGSATGYAGALNGGVGPVATTLSATYNVGAGALASGTYYLFASFSSGAGETTAISQVSAGIAVGANSGALTVKFASAAYAIPAGTLGVNLYLAASNSIAASYYVGTLVPNSSAGNTLVITSQPTSGAQPGGWAATNGGNAQAGQALDTSSSAFAYDGLLTQLTNVTGAGNGNGTGYFAQFAGSQFNGTANGIQAVGDAPFQTAMAALYGASTYPNGGNFYGAVNGGNYLQEQGNAFGAKLLADPDTILLDGTIRAALGQFLKVNAQTSAYRIMLTEGGVNGEKIGAVVNGIYNQVTGKPVDLVVEPYMPPGAAILYSKTLPVPDSEISHTFVVKNVQDYMMYEWQSMGMTWDASTYMFGTLLGYAPTWSGAITGLLA